MIQVEGLKGAAMKKRRGGGYHTSREVDLEKELDLGTSLSSSEAVDRQADYSLKTAIF